MISDILSAYGLAQDWVAAAVILATFIAVALAVHFGWVHLLRPVARRVHAGLTPVLLPPIRRVVVSAIVLYGFNEAFNSLPVPDKVSYVYRYFTTALEIIWLVVFFWQAIVASNAVANWFFRVRVSRGEDASDLGYRVTVFRKTANVLLIAVGLLMLLKASSLNITPLLAGGAITGAVIGLALQDTLSNFFAGLYLAFDRPVRVGDYIKLENAEEGYVEDIGWRNTRVRLMSNNLVVVPNSKLSQSTITNYYLPEQSSSVYITCGVSYSSDLQRVEDVAAEVGREVLARVDGADAGWEPLIRWKEFADSAITFLTILRVRQHDQKWLLQSEYIKALHSRFRAEGIDIPFPIRTTILKTESGSEPLLRLQRGDAPSPESAPPC